MSIRNKKDKELTNDIYARLIQEAFPIYEIQMTFSSFSCFQEKVRGPS